MANITELNFENFVAYFLDFQKMFGYVIVVLIISFVTWYLSFITSRKRMYELSESIPSVPSLPFIGSAHLFLNMGPTDIFHFVNKYSQKFPLYKMWFGYKLYIIATDSRDIRAILNSTKCINKADLYIFAKDVLGNGLVTSEASIWKKHRKMISPLFTSIALQDLVKTFAVHSNKLVENLYQVCEKKDIDMHIFIADCTMNVVLDSVMDIKATDSADNLKFRNCFSKFKDLMLLRFYSIWWYTGSIYNLTSLSKEINKNIKFVMEFSAKIIANKRSLYQEKDIQAKHQATETGKRKSILDFLIQDTNFTDEELLDEVNTLIITGTDTAIITAGYTFILLGMYPEIQEKVYEEIIKVLQNREIVSDDLPSLSYTRRVINESLRLFPLLPFIARSASDEIQLDTCTIPSGANIIVNIFQLHRNPEMWPDPHKFDPDRFLPEKNMHRPQASFIPFSHGSRNCIGSKYALTLLVILVAKIVRNFIVQTGYKNVDDIRVKYSLTMEPVDGYKLSLIPRK